MTNRRRIKATRNTNLAARASASLAGFDAALIRRDVVVEAQRQLNLNQALEGIVWQAGVDKWLDPYIELLGADEVDRLIAEHNRNHPASIIPSPASSTPKPRILRVGE